MDQAKVREFLDVENALIEARRKHGLLAEILEHADSKAVSGAWIRKLRLAVDDLFDALDDGEYEVLRQRAVRERRRDEAAARKSRPQRVQGAANEDLSRDPSTVPGAIRLVLSQHPDGLHMGPLVDAVTKARPEVSTTRDMISSALHPMVKRREVAREGYNKNYKYILITKAHTNGVVPDATDEPAEEQEVETE